MDIKLLRIKIPINHIKNISSLVKKIISLLVGSCNLGGIEINEILIEILSEINDIETNMVQEIKENMVLP